MAVCIASHKNLLLRLAAPLKHVKIRALVTIALKCTLMVNGFLAGLILISDMLNERK